MSVEILLSEDAVSDLANIGDYIGFQLNSPQAAKNTIASLIGAIQILGVFPESGASVLSPDNTYATPFRVLVYEKRYAISYLYEKDSQRVWVYRVFHTLQDWLAFLLKRAADTNDE